MSASENNVLTSGIESLLRSTEELSGTLDSRVGDRGVRDVFDSSSMNENDVAMGNMFGTGSHVDKGFVSMASNNNSKSIWGD